jgi:hypothetical protein
VDIQIEQNVVAGNVRKTLETMCVGFSMWLDQTDVLMVLGLMQDWRNGSTRPSRTKNSLVIPASGTDPLAVGSLTIAHTLLGKIIPARCSGLREHVRLNK